MKVNKNFLLTKSKNFIVFFYKKSWILTIIFFTAVLGFSVQVWWDCVLNPELSQKEKTLLNKESSSYEKNISKIKEAVKKIRERKEILKKKEINLKVERNFFKDDQIKREKESSVEVVQ
jgi:hypothetical protein